MSLWGDEDANRAPCEKSAALLLVWILSNFKS
jgi:hypothetical protein